MLTTATTPEFDVSRTPAPFLHLAAACLDLGRSKTVHALETKIINLYYYFYPPAADGDAPGAPADGQRGSITDTSASQVETQQAAAAGPGPTADAVRAPEPVSLMQKMKRSVLQRANNLRGAPPPQAHSQAQSLTPSACSLSQSQVEPYRPPPSLFSVFSLFLPRPLYPPLPLPLIN